MLKATTFVLATLYLLSLSPMISFADGYLKIGPTIQTPGVVTVGANGSETENGAALLSAVNAAQAYSNTLIKLGPGVYDIAAATLIMKHSVDIEGSGIEITIIKGNNSDCLGCDTVGVLQGANRSEVRNLTIKNIQNVSYGIPYAVVNREGNPKFTNVSIYTQAAASADVVAIGMLNIDAGNTYLTNVHIEVVNGTESYGIKNINSNPWLTHVKISVNSLDSGAKAYGIYNQDSSPWIKYSEIWAYFGDEDCYAIYGESSDAAHDTVHLYWSDILASGGGGNEAGIYGDAYQTSNIFSSVFDATNTVAGAGTFKCADCVDNQLNALGQTCAP